MIRRMPGQRVREGPGRAGLYSRPPDRDTVHAFETQCTRFRILFSIGEFIFSSHDIAMDLGTFGYKQVLLVLFERGCPSDMACNGTFSRI